jgi:hypothetical protein
LNTDRGKSLHWCKTLVKSLYEMNVTWFWCNRSIRVIETLAAERGVDLWSSGLAKTVDPVHFASLERHKDNGVAVNDGGGEMDFDLMAFDAHETLFTSYGF